MLFQSDMGKQSAEQVLKTFWTGKIDIDDEVRGFAEDLFRAADERKPEIDVIIEAHAPRWRIDRMAAVDRNVLRAAVAEFLVYPKTPRVVIINEALEIARKFSAPESVNFINAVLDSIAKDLEGVRKEP